MNWELVALISLGLIFLFVLCAFWGMIELEWHRRKEAKKWEEWRNKKV